MIAPQIDESALPDEKPADLVKRLSLEKARAVATKRGRGIILGADTIVVLEGVVLGKPADAAEARAMLQRLSVRTHSVFTGFALLNAESGKCINVFDKADVTFRLLRDDEIDAYIATGSPLDKAGAYGIQDTMCVSFVEKITGDINTVVGLPMERVEQALREISA